MSDKNGRVIKPKKNKFLIIRESIEDIVTRPYEKMKRNQWANVFSILRSGRLSLDHDLVSQKLFKDLSQKWRNYYYNSEVWSTVRDRKLYDDTFQCALCPSRAWQVHHLNYVRLGGRERSSDLQSLCGPCHQDQHPEHYNVN